MPHSHTSTGSDGLCGVLLCLSRINHGASAGELISGIQNYSKIQTTVFFFFSLRWTDNLWNNCSGRWSVCWQQQHGDNHGEGEVPLNSEVYSRFQQFFLFLPLASRGNRQRNIPWDGTALLFAPWVRVATSLLLPVRLYLLPPLHLSYDLLIRLIHSDLH